MKEKNIFIAILIIALIGIGAVGYRAYYNEGAVEPEAVQPVTDQIPAPSVVGTEAKSQSIIYDANGFAPKPLTVSLGTKVVFMNQSSSDVWPASAPHPAHTDYPEFDAKQPVKPGSSYEFTFDRIGTWKYHNHLNPTHFGSVIVTE